MVNKEQENAAPVTFLSYIQLPSLLGPRVGFDFGSFLAIPQISQAHYHLWAFAETVLSPWNVYPTVICKTHTFIFMLKYPFSLWPPLTNCLFDYCQPQFHFSLFLPSAIWASIWVLCVSHIHWHFCIFFLYAQVCLIILFNFISNLILF